MDIDKIINSYQAHVKDAKPEDVAEKKDATLKKIENVSALAGLLGNIRTAYDMVSDTVTGKYKGVSKSALAFLAGGSNPPYAKLVTDAIGDGWMDDAAVLGWIFTRCADEFKKYKEFKSALT